MSSGARTSCLRMHFTSEKQALQYSALSVYQLATSRNNNIDRISVIILSETFPWTIKNWLRFYVIRVWMRIHEYFEGFFDVARLAFFTVWLISLRKGWSDLQEDITIDVSEVFALRTLLHFIILTVIPVTTVCTDSQRLRWNLSLL